jgi:tRNA threonylcarbamoyladenosine modification (KEOPS) complex Cgi121 subunit
MLYFYSINSHLKNEEIISLVKEYKGIVLSPDLAVFKGFVKYCHQLAGEDFGNKQNIADGFAIEWLCRIACSQNIKNSIEFCKPANENISIVSELKMPEISLKKIGNKLKMDSPSQKLISDAAKKYGIPQSAQKKYGLEQLLKEKCLTAFLE